VDGNRRYEKLDNDDVALWISIFSSIQRSKMEESESAIAQYKSSTVSMSKMHE